MLLSGLLVTPGVASAGLRWGSCLGKAGFECAVLRVPLDRSGGVPGTVPLRVARERRAVGGGRVLIWLAGGPGEAAVSVAPFFRQQLTPALGGHRLVVLDQRGTGASGALHCPGVERSPPVSSALARLLAACAAELGQRREFYATADTVADLEALRVALGVPRLALGGTSYGTYVAQQYARAYPDRVERLVLDSVIGPNGQDPFFVDGWSALPRVLGELCAGGVCAGITDDPVGDVRELAAQLDGAPLHGTVIDGRGRPRPAKVGAVGLLALVSGGDLNFGLRVALPAAIRAALQGDARPLLRLTTPAGQDLLPPQLNLALRWTTLCADLVLPYPLASPIEDRPAMIAQALAALPDEALGPFGRGLVERTSPVEGCRLWPPGRAVPPATAPLPDVPALILTGRLDARTPLENARAVAAELPHTQLVVVPGTGHSEIASDLSGCVARALARFFADRTVGDPCARSSGQSALYGPPPPVAPTALSRLAPPQGVPGDRGRVLSAAVGALDDVRSAFLVANSLVSRGGGLRAGTWSGRVQVGAGFLVLALHGVAWAPEVRVSGRIRVSVPVGDADGALTVHAPRGLGGRLLLHRRGVAGRLGGRQVRLQGPVPGAVGPAYSARSRTFTSTICCGQRIGAWP